MKKYLMLMLLILTTHGSLMQAMRFVRKAYKLTVPASASKLSHNYVRNSTLLQRNYSSRKLNEEDKKLIEELQYTSDPQWIKNTFINNCLYEKLPLIKACKDMEILHKKLEQHEQTDDLYREFRYRLMRTIRITKEHPEWFVSLTVKASQDAARAAQNAVKGQKHVQKNKRIIDAQVSKVEQD